ncbi:MAG: type II toxin-antitoxin system PemK/MazF family toxin [Acetobacteraceae bacterium]
MVATAPATEAFGIVWVLMITSARHARWPDDVLITDPVAARLSRPSLVRTVKIASIDSRHADPVGRLPAVDCKLVARHLARHLAPVSAA